MRAEAAIREQFELDRIAREEALRIAELERASVTQTTLDRARAEQDLLRKAGQNRNVEFDATGLAAADDRVTRAQPIFKPTGNKRKGSRRLLKPSEGLPSSRKSGRPKKTSFDPLVRVSPILW